VSTNRQLYEPHSGEELVHDPKRTLTAIIGTCPTAFPINEGWYTHGQKPRLAKRSEALGDDLRRLSELSIHDMTDTLTQRIIQDASFT